MTIRLRVAAALIRGADAAGRAAGCGARRHAARPCGTARARQRVRPLRHRARRRNDPRAPGRVRSAERRADRGHGGRAPARRRIRGAAAQDAVSRLFHRRASAQSARRGADRRLRARGVRAKPLRFGPATGGLRTPRRRRDAVPAAPRTRPCSCARASVGNATEAIVTKKRWRRRKIRRAADRLRRPRAPRTRRAAPARCRASGPWTGSPSTCAPTVGPRLLASRPSTSPPRSRRPRPGRLVHTDRRRRLDGRRSAGITYRGGVATFRAHRGRACARHRHGPARIGAKPCIWRASATSPRGTNPGPHRSMTI